MVKYEIILKKENWNDPISKFENSNPYQIFEWGEYKKCLGWKILSIKANADGEIAYLQITYRIKYGIFFGWAIGSIAGSPSPFFKEEFFPFIKKHFGCKFIYLRTSFVNPLVFETSMAMYTSGWKKAPRKLNSDYSIIIDLNKTLIELQNQVSSNWRKSLKRGIQRNPEVMVKKLQEFDLGQISRVFAEFQEIKEVPLPSGNELKTLQKHLGQNIYIAVTLNECQITALRAFLFFGKKAIDFWAVANKTARENYSSFALLWKLFEKAKELEILFYDMSGIDPVENPTVFAFKNGLRGEIVEKLGEWEMTNSSFISFLFNTLYLR